MSNDFVKIPYFIERDGSKTHFLPGLGGRTGYRIGEKGSEALVNGTVDGAAA